MMPLSMAAAASSGIVTLVAVQNSAATSAVTIHRQWVREVAPTSRHPARRSSPSRSTRPPVVRGPHGTSGPDAGVSLNWGPPHDGSERASGVPAGTPEAQTSFATMRPASPLRDGEPLLTADKLRDPAVHRRGTAVEEPVGVLRRLRVGCVQR